MMIEVPGRSAAAPGGDEPAAPARDETAAAMEPAPDSATSATATRAPAAAAEPLPKTMFAPKRKLTDGELDMTPMVDVVFNLLIFFMVTASFVQQRSLQVPKPEQSDQPSTQTMEIEEHPDYVTVLVDENNTFQVTTVDWEKECAGEQELLVQLREARSGSSPPTKLLVKAHVDATHEYVVMALDAGTAVGIEEVQLVTVEESF